MTRTWGCDRHYVPWSESDSGFTSLGGTGDWLKEATIQQAVARQLKLSWNSIDGIMQRAVKRRGTSPREALTPSVLESMRQLLRNDMTTITVVSGQDEGIVLHVGQDCKMSNLKNWYEQLSKEQIARIQSVSMDMWPAYINATVLKVSNGSARGSIVE